MIERHPDDTPRQPHLTVGSRTLSTPQPPTSSAARAPTSGPAAAEQIRPEVSFQRNRQTPGRLNNSPRRTYDLLRSALASTEGEVFLVEGDLTEALSASRNTVRSVLQQLAREGLVTRAPKNGTRACGSLLLPIHQLSPVADFGGEPSARFEARRLERQSLGCPPMVRDRLNLPQGWTVLMIESLLLQDGEPFGISVCYVALGAEHDPELDVDHSDVLVILECELGVQVRGSRTTIGAVAADKQSAELIGVAVGAPLIWLEDVIEDQSGQPRALSQLRLRGDRVAFSATAHRSA